MSASLGVQFAPDVAARARAHTAYTKDHTENYSVTDSYWSDHPAHGPNPVFHDIAGWGESACGHSDCAHYDKAFDDKAYSVYEKSPDDRRSHIQRLNPRTAPLRAMEPDVDLPTVARYAAQEPVKKRPPVVVEHQGALHILDGHHRLLGAWLSGRDIDVEVHR